jgi:hypothetical protein
MTMKLPDLGCHTMTLADAEAAAKALGVTVTIPHATGEVMFTYPGMPSVRINRRKPKAVGRHVVAFLRRLAKAQGLA